jgi:hypothetical protein
VATVTAPPQIIWTCKGCGATRSKPEKRLPHGWKRLDADDRDDIYCDVCWKQRFVLRAVTIPLTKPLGCDWKDLRVALRNAWAQSTQIHNWMMTELYARDVRRNGEEKMPAMSRVYLYPEARQRFPGLPSQTVASIENTVQQKYRALRYKIIWTCQASLATYRYPTPFQVPNQGWNAYIENERLVVSVRISDERFQLQLRGGPGFRRQRGAIEKIIAGAAVQGELALYERGSEVMCKMVAWLPRDTWVQRQQRTGTLSVRTAADTLIIALNAKDETLWKYHADHLRRWVQVHRRQLQRLSDDQKAEQRPIPKFVQHRDVLVRKYHNRIDSACHEIAAMIAGYAHRRHFAMVKYDDSQQSYLESFPWLRLRSLIAEKLDLMSIEFEHSEPTAPIESKEVEEQP